MKKTLALFIALVMVLAIAPSFSLADENVVLTVATWDATAGSSSYLNAQKAAFEASHPGVTIEYVDVAGPDWDAPTKKASVMLAGGDTSDVYDIKELSNLQEWIEQGFVEDLTPYIEASGFDTGKYVGVEKSYQSLDGVQYGLPYRSDFWVLFYNKTLFDAAGVPYPKDDMTWEEYKELALQMTSGEGVDQIYGAHYHSTWLSAVACWAVCGTDYTLADGTYDNLAYFYQLAQDLEDAGAVMAYSEYKAAGLHYRGVFETGSIAMLPMGYWFVATLINDMAAGDSAEFEWGITNVPHMEGIPAGSSFGGPTGTCINKKSDQKDLAWEFISWRCGEEGALATAATGTRPAYVSKAVAEVMASVEGFPPDEASLAALLPVFVALEWPTGEKVNEIKTIVDKEEHVNIMSRSVTIEEGIENMNTRVAEVLGN